MQSKGKESKTGYVRNAVKQFTYWAKFAKSASFLLQNQHQIFCLLHQLPDTPGFCRESLVSSADDPKVFLGWPREYSHLQG